MDNRFVSSENKFINIPIYSKSLLLFLHLYPKLRKIMNDMVKWVYETAYDNHITDLVLIFDLYNISNFTIYHCSRDKLFDYTLSQGLAAVLRNFGASHMPQSCTILSIDDFNLYFRDEISKMYFIGRPRPFYHSSCNFIKYVIHTVNYDDVVNRRFILSFVLLEDDSEINNTSNSIILDSISGSPFLLVRAIQHINKIFKRNPSSKYDRMLKKDYLCLKSEMNFISMSDLVETHSSKILINMFNSYLNLQTYQQC